MITLCYMVRLRAVCPGNATTQTQPAYPAIRLVRNIAPAGTRGGFECGRPARLRVTIPIKIDRRQCEHDTPSVSLLRTQKRLSSHGCDDAQSWQQLYKVCAGSTKASTRRLSARLAVHVPRVANISPPPDFRTIAPTRAATI